MTNFDIIINKLCILDPAAARYVKEKYDIPKYVYCREISSIFTWASSPQGDNYWRTLYHKMKEMGDIVVTPRGNSLDSSMFKI